MNSSVFFCIANWIVDINWLMDNDSLSQNRIERCDRYYFSFKYFNLTINRIIIIIYLYLFIWFILYNLSELITQHNRQTLQKFDQIPIVIFDRTFRIQLPINPTNYQIGLEEFQQIQQQHKAKKKQKKNKERHWSCKRWCRWKET